MVENPSPGFWKTLAASAWVVMLFATLLAAVALVPLSALTADSSAGIFWWPDRGYLPAPGLLALALFSGTACAGKLSRFPWVQFAEWRMRAISRSALCLGVVCAISALAATRRINAGVDAMGVYLTAIEAGAGLALLIYACTAPQIVAVKPRSEHPRAG